MIACLRFVPFALWHARQCRPELQDRVIVASDKDKVTAVSDEAKAQGIDVGLSLDGARARVDDLYIIDMNPVSLRHAWDALLSQLYGFSDRIESPEIGRVFLDLSLPELQLVTQMYQVRGGLAASQELAELLALTAEVGGCQANISPAALPLRHLSELGLSLKDLRRLEWLGLMTIGDLQPWKRGQLESFLNEDSHRIIRYLKGPYRQEVARFKAPVTLRVSYRFSEAVSEPYQLLPILDCLAARLETQLVGQVAYRLHLRATASGLVFSGSRLSKLPLVKASMIVRQAQLALQDSGVLGLGIAQLELELSAVVREVVQPALWQQRAQVSRAVEVVSERFAGSLFVYQEVNPYMPSAEFQFRKQFLGQEGGADEATQRQSHQSGWHTHTGERSARITAHRQLSSVA